MSNEITYTVGKTNNGLLIQGDENINPWVAVYSDRSNDLVLAHGVLAKEEINEYARFLIACDHTISLHQKNNLKTVKIKISGVSVTIKVSTS